MFVYMPSHYDLSLPIIVWPGDLPIKMEYLIGGDKISWTVDIGELDMDGNNSVSRSSHESLFFFTLPMPQLDKLDYGLYLPLFFDGLSETQHPYNKFARQGVQDLLANGGDKIYAIIPQLIIPIKNALNTKNIDVMCTVLKIIQQLVNASDLIGPALIPFYRQLLPVFNAYKMRNSESLNFEGDFRALVRDMRHVAHPLVTRTDTKSVVNCFSQYC